MEADAAVIGEQSSVETLYRSDADRLWRALYAFSGDPEVASGAVAEAYAQLIGRGALVRDPAAWTWRAAFRTVINAEQGQMVLLGPDMAEYRGATGFTARLARFPGPKHIWICS